MNTERDHVIAWLAAQTDEVRGVVFREACVMACRQDTPSRIHNVDTDSRMPLFRKGDKVLHLPSETVGTVYQLYPANAAREASLIVMWQGTDRLSGLLPEADFVTMDKLKR